MKKKILSILLVLFIGVFIFTGCGFDALKGGPALTDTITSNGGMAVQKGNYLYCVNGYLKVTDLTDDDNKFGNVEQSALVRVKLDADGNILKGGEEDFGVLAPKVVGFENGGISIFDDRIYYASPYSEKNTSGENEFKKTDFFSSNLDGSDVKRIYTTEVASTSFKFAFYKFAGEVYLAVYDSSSLFIINVNSYIVTKVSENVTSVVFPVVSDYVCNAEQNGDNLTAAEKNVYYTRSAKDEDKVDGGNILAMASLIGKEEVVLAKNATYSVKDFKSDNLIYTKTNLNESSAVAYYYVAEYSNSKMDCENAVKQTEGKLSNEPVILPFVNGNYNGMVVSNSEGDLLYIKPLNRDGVYQGFDCQIIYASTGDTQLKLTPIAVFGNYVYAYDKNNQLYRFEYATTYTEATPLISKDDHTFIFSMNVKIDEVKGYIYVYEKYEGDSETAYYLVRINGNLTQDYSVEVLGKVLDKHIKTATEE